MEELYRMILEQLENAQISLHKAELGADRYGMNRYSKIEQEKEILISATATSITLGQSGGHSSGRTLANKN